MRALRTSLVSSGVVIVAALTAGSLAPAAEAAPAHMPPESASGPPALLQEAAVEQPHPSVRVLEVREATPEEVARARRSTKQRSGRAATSTVMDQAFCLSVVPGSECHMEAVVGWGWYVYVFNYLAPPSTHASLPPYQGSCTSACFLHVVGGGPGVIPTGWALSGQNFASIISVESIDP